MSSEIDMRNRMNALWPLLGAALLVLWACGDQNLFGPAVFSPPGVDIRQPVEGEGVPVGDSVLVEVTLEPSPLSRSGAIERVIFDGVAHVGDPELGTSEERVFYPARSVDLDPPVTETVTLSRYLSSNGDTTSAPVYIRVTAVDELGNEGKDSVAVRLGAPGLRFISPVDGESVAPGSTLTVDVRATDVDGVASLEVTAAESGLQPSELPLFQTYSPEPDTARLTQTITVPDQTGTIELSARAVNRNGVEGVIGPITVNVTTQPTGDDEAPELRVQYLPGGSETEGERVESTDDLTFLVEGRDNPGGSGVAEIGLTVRAQPRGRATEERVIPIVTRTVSPSRSGTFSTRIDVPVATLEAMGPLGDRTLDLSQSPDTVNLEIFAFMVDAQDNCAAAVSSTDFQSLECSASAGDTVAAGAQGQEASLVGVAGQTVALPRGGVIADAVVDTARDLLVLSNQSQGRLEVFDIATRTFDAGILVGAEPWGMTFSRTDSDTLYVGNSFGTNISIVDLVSRTEHVARRIQTPNSVLFDATENFTEVGYELTVEIHGFSDRPQFIAQDAVGNMVYSTLPTSAAELGTIRLATPPGPGRPETEVILYTDHAEREPQQRTVAIDRLDRFDEDALAVVDHVPGTNSILVEPIVTTDNPSPVDAAVARVNGAGGDARAFPGSAWNVGSVGLSDTTFVSASGDGTKVAIGEGATAPTGRIIMYDAATQEVSGLISVEDLVQNAAERVLGVDMNYDGTMGVARGLEAVYFFTADLRLQGGVGVTPGGAGAALHPLHTDGPTGTDPNVAVAFAGTGERTIEVFDTRHFTRIGEVAIRENISGQIRAIMPDDSDQPAGFPSCTSASQEVDIPGLGGAKRVFSDANGFVINDDLADACVVVRLAGVTDSGGVVIVDVTKGDLLSFHPDA